MPVISSMRSVTAPRYPNKHEGLVVPHVVGVHLLAGQTIGMAADDVLGGDEVVEAGAFDRLREVLEEPRVVARCRDG